MNILGLHFGHDAGIAVLVDGYPANNMIRERKNRAKHAFGINVSHIEEALSDAELVCDDVDMIAITSTQCYELVVVDRPDDLKIEFEPHPDMNIASSLYDAIKSSGVSLEDRLDGTITDVVYSLDEKKTYHRNLFPEHIDVKKSDLGITKSLRDYISIPIWDNDIGLKDMANMNVKAILDAPSIRAGFHYPITVVLNGRRVPGVMVQHHAAHAASSYYTSKSNAAAVLTHDGAFYKVGPSNGMIFYGEGHKLLPIIPNHLAIGDLYDQTGALLGFDLFGAAGKLMGLAPYGKPRFFSRKFVGNSYDLSKSGITEPVKEWFSHCVETARKLGYDLSPLGDVDRILEPICIDIAASTQKLFEEVLLFTAETTASMFNYNGITTDTLCYSGGTGLNCPANSRIAAESPFENLHVPPNCDDSGLSLGAAQFFYHNVLDMPRKEWSTEQLRTLPYLGMLYSDDQVAAAIEAVKDDVIVEYLKDPAQQAARDIHENKIIAWYEGRSEIGPRALGHRSLLVTPKHAENWARMNELKIREKWRPFAPAVLAEDVSLYFRGMPEESPFMLFTAQVSTTELPAITHVDGSARVQTVTSETGGLFDVLTSLKEISGCSVVMNTSFNGPREPIVEKPEEALHFLLTTKLDALYIEGIRITRK